MKGLKKDMVEHSTRVSLFGLLPTGFGGEHSSAKQWHTLVGKKLIHRAQ